MGGKPPKWMVKIMENPMNKWMIWGYPYFWKHPIGHLPPIFGVKIPKICWNHHRSLMLKQAEMSWAAPLLMALQLEALKALMGHCAHSCPEGSMDLWKSFHSSLCIRWCCRDCGSAYLFLVPDFFCDLWICGASSVARQPPWDPNLRQGLQGGQCFTDRFQFFHLFCYKHGTPHNSWR